MLVAKLGLNSSFIKILFFSRNDCEMTHFFFSLNREPIERPMSEMPITFSFDTHIITQININVKHTLFDKVEIGKRPKSRKKIPDG